MLLSLIIPTYNEAQNVPLFLEEVFQHLPQNIQTEVIVVDDNSPDGTAEIAAALAGKYPVRVIKRTGKFGLGSAVRAGFAAAKGDIFGVMDADLSHDPKIIPELVGSLASHDIAVGSRFLPESRVDNWPWYRKLISKIGTFLAGRKTARPVADALSGYFFMHRRVVKDVPLTTDGYKILFEILCKGEYHSVREIPFHFRKRAYSQSKLNWREHWLFLKQLLSYARTPRS